MSLDKDSVRDMHVGLLQITFTQIKSKMCAVVMTMLTMISVFPFNPLTIYFNKLEENLLCAHNSNPSYLSYLRNLLSAKEFQIT